MNWDTIRGHRTESGGKLREHRGKLTDSHLDMIAGQRDQLASETEEACEVSRHEVEEQVLDFDHRTH